MEAEQQTSKKKNGKDAQKQIEALDQSIVKFEQQKRWSDLTRLLREKAELVEDVSEKVDLLHQAATLYLERSRNQSEAIVCFELILSVSENDGKAIEHLKELYKARGRWEDLVRLLQKQVDHLEPAQQLAQTEEIARLAMEHVRKPELCIEMWERVRKAVPEHREALTSLAQLYERARSWEPLAEVLETLVSIVTVDAELQQYLQKLGVIYADKVGDDERAVRVFQRLLSYDPEDRRAQEQLKRRYVVLGAWDELEAFYAQNEKWDELIRVLERQAESPDVSPDEHRMLLFRAARLWSEKLDRADRAARVYEKVLEQEPENMEAAEALTPIYETGRDPRKFVAICELRLKHTTDEAVRVLLLRKVARVYEERMRNIEAAFEKYLEAFRTDPRNDEAREDAARVAEQLGAWEALLSGYEAAIAHTTDPERSIEIRLHYGTALSKLERFEPAIEQFRAAYELDPSNTLAIQALADLYFRTNSYRELLEIYDRRMEIEENPELRLDIQYRQAQLWEEALEEPEKAVDVYERIIDDHGIAQEDACRALDRLYEKQGRWEDAVALLEKRLEEGQHSAEETAALKFRIARTLQDHVGDLQRAVALYRDVLGLLPEHEGARTALESLLTEDDVKEDAAELLQLLYEQRADFDHVVRMMRVRFSATDIKENKLQLLWDIAQVYLHRLNDPARGFDTFAEAFRLEPSHASILAELERLALATGRWSDLVSLVREVASEVQDAALSRGLWMRAAEMYDAHLRDVNAAVACYRAILERDESDVEVLSLLELLYRREQRWPEVITVLRARVQASSDVQERVQILREVATIESDILHEDQEAIRAYREILDEDPTDADAHLALDHLYESQGMWSELAGKVERQIEVAVSPEIRQSHMLRLATLRVQRLNDLEAGLDLYRDVLTEDRNNAGAVSALEELLLGSQLQERVADILEPIYEARSDASRLIGIYQVQAEHADTSDRKYERHVRIAELQEQRLNDVTGAFQSWANALAVDPQDDKARSNLDRLAQRMGDPAAMARVYAQLAEKVDDKELATQLHMQTAELYEQRIGDLQAAISHLRRVFELDADHQDAINGLERLYQRSKEYDKLADIYAAKASLVSNAEEQRDYLFKSGSVYEELLEQPENAARVYERVLEIDAGDERALNRLIALYESLQRWPRLIDVYKIKADLLTDPDARCTILRRVAEVYETQLQDQRAALDIYRQALDLAPEDLDILRRLDALYVATEQWSEVIDVLEREVALVRDHAEKIELRYRIGEVCRLHLDQAQRAIDTFSDVLNKVDYHQGIVDSLQQLLAGGVEPVAAADLLVRVYEAQENYSALAASLEQKLPYVAHAEEKSELFAKLANVYEQKLKDPERALESYARWLEHDHTSEPAVLELSRLGSLLNRWARVSEVLDAAVERQREKNPEEVVQLAVRSASIAEHRLGDVDQAIGKYRQALELDASNLEALEALDRIFQDRSDWRSLAQVLQQEAEYASTPEDVLQYKFRLGVLNEQQLGDLDSAVETYKEIVAAAPERDDVVNRLQEIFDRGDRTLEIAEILEPHYRMNEQWHKLDMLYGRQVTRLESSEEAVALMHRAAEMAELKAGDLRSAFVWMQQALLRDPKHDHTLGEIERLGGELGQWNEVAVSYVRAIEVAPDDKSKIDLAFRLARIYDDELHDTERTEETYRYVLGLKPKNARALRELDRIYKESGAALALVDVLRRRLEITDDKEQRIELANRLGQTLSVTLGRHEEAVEVYENILRNDDVKHLPSIQALEGIYERAGRYNELMATYEREIEAALGDAHQARVYSNMARLCEDQLHDRARAIQFWRRVLDLRGEEPEALNALGDLYALEGDWSNVVDVLDREAEVVDDADWRLQIFSDLATINFEKLNQPQRAIDNWERVLDADPKRLDALLQIAQIHRSTSQWGDVVETLQRVVSSPGDLADPAQVAQAYQQIGYVSYRELGLPDDAIAAYRKVLEFDSHDSDALNSLEYLYREKSDWEAAIEIMEMRLDTIESPEERIKQLLSIAEVWTTNMGKPEGATSAYERILQIDRAQRYALSELEKIHRVQESWQLLADHYVRWAEAVSEPAERVKVLQNLAQVYDEKLNLPEQAYEALQIAWTEDLQDDATVRKLERLTAALDRWNDLLETANALLRATDDPKTKIAICLHCAKWYGQDLGYPEYAIPYYEQIKTLDPTHAKAWWQLADLYETTQQWESLAQVLGRVVEMTDDNAVRADMHVRMGRLVEDRFRDRVSAEQSPESCYRRALDLVPDHMGAIEALERIYREEGRSHKLLNILERKAQATTDPEAAVRARVQVADTYENILHDEKAAMDSYAQILEVDATNRDALRGLRRLYRADERWQPLAGILERLLDVVETEQERVSVLSELSQLHEEQFRRPERAAELLEQVLDVDPRSAEALTGLARLYATTGAWDRLVDTLERHIDVAVERSEKIALLDRLGKLHREERKDTDAAIRAYERIAEIEPEHKDALHSLSELQIESETYDQALQSMEKLAALTEMPAEQVRIQYEIGQILDQHLGNPESAREHFNRAREIDPTYLPALDALGRSYRESGDWQQAVRVIEQAIEHDPAPRAKAERLIVLGKLLLENLSLPERAVASFEQALQYEPTSREAALPLVDFYTSQERYADAFNLLKMLTETGEGKQQYDLCNRLGQAAIKIKDYKEAIGAFERAAQMRPDEYEPLRGLGDAYFHDGEWENAQKQYQLVLVQHRDVLGRDGTTELYVRQGQIKRKLGELVKARNMFNKALEEEPHHQLALESLAEIYADEAFQHSGIRSLEFT